MPAIIFDLDDTLAESKQPLSPEMSHLLGELLTNYQVGIISGAGREQMITQVADRLGNVDLDHLHLLPSSGSTYLQYDRGILVEIYHDVIPLEEAERIGRVLTGASRTLGLDEPNPDGPRVEHRGGQVTFSGCGQSASVERKRTWDPSGERRSKLSLMAQTMLPRYEVKTGGSTSVDVTLKGHDKALGVRRFLSRTNVPTSQTIFIGDSLHLGGNDYPVTTTGVRCISTRGPRETITLVRAFTSRTASVPYSP